jgi:hypothetical protein
VADTINGIDVDQLSAEEVDKLLERYNLTDRAVQRRMLLMGCLAVGRLRELGQLNLKAGVRWTMAPPVRAAGQAHVLPDDVHQADARTLVDWMERTIPCGTYDALMRLMLDRRVRRLRDCGHPADAENLAAAADLFAKPADTAGAWMTPPLEPDRP